MKILAVDTSTMVASVAIIENEKILVEYTINSNKTHSQRLMPMISEVLKNIELETSDIDIFSSTIGPGSFTGLRIGVTTVKALAYALKKEVIGVSTLEALAFNLSSHSEAICPIIDARNDQVYTGIYNFKDYKSYNTVPDCAMDINLLIEQIKNTNKRIMFVGDGVYVYKSYLESLLGEQASFAQDNLNILRASSVAQVALNRAKDLKFDNALTLKPEYLRKTSAEREYIAKHGDC